MATREELNAQKAAIAQQVAPWQREIAAWEKELAELPAIEQREHRNRLQMFLGGGKPDDAKVVAIEKRAALLRDAVRARRAEIAAAQAPLAGIELELARLDAAEMMAEARALMDELRAGIVQLGAQYARLHADAMALKENRAAPAEWVAVWDATYKLRGAGVAKEILDWHDAGGY